MHALYFRLFHVSRKFELFLLFLVANTWQITDGQITSRSSSRSERMGDGYASVSPSSHGKIITYCIETDGAIDGQKHGMVGKCECMRYYLCDVPDVIDKTYFVNQSIISQLDCEVCCRLPNKVEPKMDERLCSDLSIKQINHTDAATCSYPPTQPGRTCMRSKCENNHNTSSCTAMPGVQAEKFVEISCWCENGYTQSTDPKDNVTYCINGEWLPKIPECIKCGVRTTTEIETKIIGGDTAEKDSIPWQVAIYRTNLENFELTCGGTIMTPILIISAAHCFYDEKFKKLVSASEFQIAVGKFTSNYRILDSPHTRIIKVKQFYIPQSYIGSGTNFASDIAIIEIEQLITISDQVMPICINWSPTSTEPPLFGKVAGWGYTKTDDISENLQVADFPYTPLNKCTAMVQNKWFTTAISQLDKFCAGTNSGAGVREGDSGGGWIYERDKCFYLYGVVSFKENNPNGNSTSYFAAFTRIDAHLLWMSEIKNKVEKARNIRSV